MNKSPQKLKFSLASFKAGLGSTIALFAVALSPAAQAVGESYTSSGLSDWDRDGHIDVIARESATGKLWLYPGESVRGYSNAQRVQIGNGWSGFTFAGIADWDRDGHQDIVTREEATGKLWLYPGESRRGYGSAQRVQIGNGWGGYTAFGLADWDRDGHQDVIARENISSILWLYPGQSKRGYSIAQRVQIGNGW